MKTYTELGTVHRTEPCVEYPGAWILYVSGEEQSRHESLELAKVAGRAAYERSDPRGWDNGSPDISICWSCSNYDPRMGQVWFTGFYQAGRFDSLGRFKE